jgi:hypothetical protein
LPNGLPKLNGTLKSFGADGYQSISGLLGKTMIDFLAARPVRPLTWSTKSWITSFNARTSFAGLQCEYGLPICPRHSGRSWNTSYSVINALHSGASAWIEGKPIPDV